LKNYFNEVDEESVKDNFVTIYELLDECMDFGLPQTTESDLLKDFIKVEGAIKIDKLERIQWEKGFMHVVQTLSEVGRQTTKEFLQQQLVGSKSDDTSKKLMVPQAMTNSVSWRKEGIFYKENKIFLDVIEKINMIVSASGKTVQSEIQGQIKVKCELSGMPELKLGLNDKVLFEVMKRDLAKAKTVDLEDVKFHQCVQLTQFKDDRTITFVPPDGEFVLMSYRLDQRVKPLIMVESHVEKSSSRIEFTIKAKAQFKSDSTASEVQILIAVPKDCSKPKFSAATGIAKYLPEQDVLCWTITNFQGGKSFTLAATVTLPSMKSDDDVQVALKTPILCKFQIPYYTVSGLQVRYLKIIFKKGDFSALPWVRYYCESDKFQIRLV